MQGLHTELRVLHHVDVMKAPQEGGRDGECKA